MSAGPGLSSDPVGAVFTGVGVALVTVFNDDLSVDTAGTADLAVALVDSGVRGVVVAGSTGEAASLDATERVELVSAVRNRVPSDIPVIAGTGAPSSRQAVALSRDAEDAGADAVLVLSPPSTGDPRRYYSDVADAVGIRVLAYHYPAVSSPGIRVDLLAELPVVGLKDSTGDADRLLAELDAWDRPIYPGSSALVTMAGAVGCPGVILAVANAEPELCVAAFSGDGGAQRKLAAAHFAQRRSFPRSIKELTAARFGIPTTARMGE